MMRIKLNFGRKELGQETKGLWQDNTLSNTSTLIMIAEHKRLLNELYFSTRPGVS